MNLETFARHRFTSVEFCRTFKSLLETTASIPSIKPPTTQPKLQEDSIFVQDSRPHSNTNSDSEGFPIDNVIPTAQKVWSAR